MGPKSVSGAGQLPKEPSRKTGPEIDTDSDKYCFGVLLQRPQEYNFLSTDKNVVLLTYYIIKKSVAVCTLPGVHCVVLI